ncbi:hypothetical protein [Methylobacter psychrophilus]|uniref:hypothetical protein n=1 Tax=Methylobacter psychrophilus TaxID=96941 RepID=UPI0021D5135A|nr:hypothetical protein [Methylobacter psychrophilus]
MKSKIPTPKFEISNRLVSPLEIDMWNIKGNYADGAWHKLIHVCAKDWAAKKRFAGTATIWSSVMPSANFETYTNACYVAAFGMAGFMNQLETTLSGHISSHVRRSGEMQVERGSWRPYLHLEQGKIWIISDDVEWVESE